MSPVQRVVVTIAGDNVGPLPYDPVRAVVQPLLVILSKALQPFVYAGRGREDRPLVTRMRYTKGTRLVQEKSK